jgi:homoserine dehydrogenase
VLAEAQAKGYAEADPTFDVEGMDTAHKLAIIAALVTGRQPRLNDIPTQGITDIDPVDIQFAGEFGFKVKLLALLHNHQDGWRPGCTPPWFPRTTAGLGQRGLQRPAHQRRLGWRRAALRPGRGPRPTASAVVGDVIDLARDVLAGCPGRVPPLGSAQPADGALEVAELNQASSQYYTSASAPWTGPACWPPWPGCWASTASPSRRLSKRGAKGSGPVPIVMLTHEATEADVAQALGIIDSLDVISRPTTFIRVA